MKILIPFLLLMSQFAIAQEVTGFLLGHELFVPVFRYDEGTWKLTDSKFSFKKPLNIFFDQKNLGELKVLGPYKECFKIYTTEETNKTKHCAKGPVLQFDSVSKVLLPDGPCPGDLGGKVDCPDKEKRDIQVVSSSDFMGVQITEEVRSKIAKPMATKRLKIEWGLFASFNGFGRPLLVTQEKVSDPDGWHPISFSKIPSEIQKKIFSEALSTRRSQTGYEKDKEITVPITEKDLIVGRSYQNKKGNKFAVPLQVKQCPSCSEMPVPSAYVIYYDNKAVDILKEQNWNSRDLELLETADVTKDGVSEIFFVDYEYNRDGFSVYDFKTGQLVKYGRSSH